MTSFAPVASALMALGLAVAMPGHAMAQESAGELPRGVTGSDVPSASTQDEDFAKTASGLLIPQVDASKLGAEKAEDPQLASLSRQMADEYAELLRKLEDIAQAAGHGASKSPDIHGVHRLQRLEDAGPGFDLAFLAEQESWHKKLIAIYSMEGRAGQNKALKAYAEAGRSDLMENLQAMEQIRSRLTEKRQTPG